MLITPQISVSRPEDELAARVAAVRARMAQAACAAGRDVHSVTLLAVSKGHDLSRVRAALALGLADFGENYLDEALPKIRALEGSGVRWHFIGRLQANKTRPVATHFDWVHGVDRLRIGERLSAQRPFHAAALNVCIQVHIADDPAKGGVPPGELLPLLHAVAPLPRLRLRGLMCMLPHDIGAAEQRAAFARLAALAREARAAGLPLDTLSMGMSADFEAAITEGATIVRIGTALFGDRMQP
ncbi:MAG TPA: YggS family pyridoxal phosphate-dependent enzyme [Steroidobacteraceae bacterium]|nr:YggS family pyridoxal phosphate-dependent enzyme [Steroidobacteraceae bacterium]